MHVLEGESLLNDASGLVCMRFAVAAALLQGSEQGVGLGQGGSVIWENPHHADYGKES